MSLHHVTSSLLPFSISDVAMGQVPSSTRSDPKSVTVIYFPIHGKSGRGLGFCHIQLINPYISVPQWNRWDNAGMNRILQNAPIDEVGGFEHHHRMLDLFGRVRSERVSLCDALRSPLSPRVSVGVVVEAGFVPDLWTEHGKCS